MSNGTFTTPVTATGGTQATAAPVTKASAWTVCNYTTGGLPASAIILFPAAVLGDVVEFHGNGGLSIFPAVGEKFAGAAVNAQSSATGYAITVRCVALGVWSVVSVSAYQ